MKTKHPPTPFEFDDKTWGQPAIKCPRGLVALMGAGYSQTQKDDAQFIILAANAYEALLSIVKRELETEGSVSAEEMEKAIAKAEGK
jgi:hypothetical protein